jgi:DNA-binding HxlR family transcriptional regulator
MQQVGDFCSYEKAVEHLADRWIFLIVRELAQHGSRGFNALAEGLPGISRSVLARRLRKLEDFGLVVRDVVPHPRLAPYRLAPAGEHLVPTLLSLNDWAERWVPEDPAVAQYDPDVITFWLTRRVDPHALPDPGAVLVFQIGGPQAQQAWLVLERGTTPSICVEDPLLPAHRYVHVEADAAALYPISRGLLGWEAAIRNRSVRLFGEPDLVRALPAWFRPASGSQVPARAASASAVA